MATKSGYRAIARYVLVSPFKVRPVADTVRRRPYTEAVAILDHLPQKGDGMPAGPICQPPIVGREDNHVLFAVSGCAGVVFFLRDWEFCPVQRRRLVSIA